MIDVIEYLGRANGTKNFIYGTNEFEYVWESMVDSIFGEKNKLKYYPHCVWNIDGVEHSSEELGFRQATLRPDTIMITEKNTENQRIFVLDSKYYRYGVSGNLYHLPMSDSIIKQIAYAEFIDEREEEKILPKSKAIYNAFIMPFDAKGADKKIKLIGTACTDYKSGEKPYYKIKAVLVDIKFLMEHYSKSSKIISELADVITGNTREKH